MTLIDSELTRELGKYVQSDQALSILNAEATNDLLKTFSSHHRVDLQKLWIWTQVSNEANTRHYSHCEEAIEILEQLVPKARKDFILVVTDDELPPWIAISSSTLMPLLTLISEHRFFEFFLTSSDASWFAFDTHHNSIVHSNFMAQTAP